ncbi:MAG: SAM-dependent methyltransferase [Kutzneria sp.]|nr:SAM-dependent methyltransferase [Kutzneria sp.]MBV9845412.1 SAM-dependent methyltransferase [Kutzneria sp.]
MSELAGVGRTALWVALGRVVESARDDRLFADPLASQFIDAAGIRTPSDEVLAELIGIMGDYVAIRTRFFDDCAIRACEAGCRQIVVLGAGLDTRAFRLPWPAGVRLFEVDLPAVLDFKDTVLARVYATPGCARATVAADLSQDWIDALRRAGFRPDQATGWLAEGVLPYLEATDAQHVVQKLHSMSARGSRLALEHDDPDVFEAPLMRRMSELLGFDLAALTARGRRVDPREWLAGRGWLTSCTDPAEQAAVYRRPVPPVFDPAVPGSAAEPGRRQRYVLGCLPGEVSPPGS